VQRIVQAGFDRASAILAANRGVLDNAARALLAKETLDEAEIASLAAGPRQAAASSQQEGGAV
jgi:cell division protease FtsH